MDYESLLTTLLEEIQFFRNRSLSLNRLVQQIEALVAYYPAEPEAAELDGISSELEIINATILDESSGKSRSDFEVELLGIADRLEVYLKERLAMRKRNT